ncbi:hypothetical protein DPMN_168207 [Dreissena polymorpha]|uniref:Uncharacterized protein n=1 Tax=Dreissena polymorpha TaxID=45954 RepID=A0A9D4F1J2_DREPO|nr:hypothetical protein DPMN_168207 [Dreissena polymorpha]
MRLSFNIMHGLADIPFHKPRHAKIGLMPFEASIALMQVWSGATQLFATKSRKVSLTERVAPDQTVQMLHWSNIP